MLSRIRSGALIGVDAVEVEIEIHAGAAGEPKTLMVGLPDTAVKESLERVSSAITNSGYLMPFTRLTVNLAPGDLKKEGPIYDLPIALGILATQKIFSDEKLKDYIIAGELSLSGNLRGICGGVSLALLARKLGLKGVILPPQSAAEAVLVDGVEVYEGNSLSEIVEFFKGNLELKKMNIDSSPYLKQDFLNGLDFADVKGQYQARRAVEIAVSGGHNILMVGPPGSGKSMIAKRISSIMPMPTMDEFLEILGIYSASGLSLDKDNKIFKRPFRTPHHTISDVALIGGGSNPKPGEISLAHNGVLFLDELPEFKRNVLEVMRQPLEDAQVSISRSSAKITIPCRFMLVAAMNPCPCGYLGDKSGKCKCSHSQIQRYRSKISGPLLDRIDIHVEVSALPVSDFTKDTKAESSEDILKRVLSARQIQAKRFENSMRISKTNASMDSKDIKKYCHLANEELNILSMAMEELDLSARAWDRIIKVARTIADLENAQEIQTHHLLEAINYRCLDIKL